MNGTKGHTAHLKKKEKLFLITITRWYLIFSNYLFCYSLPPVVKLSFQVMSHFFDNMINNNYLGTGSRLNRRRLTTNSKSI